MNASTIIATKLSQLPTQHPAFGLDGMDHGLHEGEGLVSTTSRASAALPGPLIPPELLETSIVYQGSLRGRESDPTSLLRLLSRPGHIYGEGLRRLYLGEHPQDPEATKDGTGSRTFLIGIEALWAEQRAERRKGNQANGGIGEATTPSQRGSPVATKRFAPDHVGTSRSEVKGKGREERREQDDDAEDSSDSSSSSEGSSSEDLDDSEDEGETSSTPQRQNSRAVSRATGSTDADALFSKLRSGDNRKELSDGSAEHGHEGSAETPIEADILSSRRKQESPAPLEELHESPFYTSTAFLTRSGKRAVDKPLKDETLERMKSLPSQNGLEGLHLELHHQLTRRQSETLVPETASDTAVVSRPKAKNMQSTKSVKWDATQKKAKVPKAKKLVTITSGGDGDQPTASPSEVLARPDHLEQPVQDALNGDNTTPKLSRSLSSESIRLLSELAETKEASLPPGIEKLERMLVRVGWTAREDLPEDFDELAARRYPMRFERWEEMAVAWKKGRLELWGTYKDPFRRFFTGRLQLKHVISMNNRYTHLSVFTAADGVFSLRCPAVPLGGHHQSGKPGLRNKRHLGHRGTLVFLLRGRAPSIAEDWYLGLHIELEKERISTMEVYSPDLGIRVRLSTNADAHDTAPASPAISRVRQLMTGGLPHHNLVSKEEMLESVKTLLSKRADWAELLHLLDREGQHLSLAWRKGTMLQWLVTDRSVDGVNRIWDVYAGAVMKQASQSIHRLEVHPEIHSGNSVQIAYDKHLIEPPGIEGFISRLKFRNENQTERLYLSSSCGFLVVTKAARALPPDFPSTAPDYLKDLHDQSTGKAISAMRKQEHHRILQNLLRCRGAIRLRDIVEINVDDSCSHCRNMQGKKMTDTASKIAASLAGKTHDHDIVEIKLSDVRKVRFEVDSPETAKEWVDRLKGLVEYWTKREKLDAKEQLLLSGKSSVKPAAHDGPDQLPPFLARELEDQETDTSDNDPLLAQAFSLCVYNGCRDNIRKQGRLYYKKGHRDSHFLDMFFVLAGDHMVQFETVKRNIQKRPIPIAYHRRRKTIKLRDVYVVTGEGCSDFLAVRGQSTFNPSTDQSGLARIYRDGLVSVDDPLDCTFMLWKQKTVGKTAPLGRDGKAYVFQARSKLERDQWVQALNVTCEKVARTGREREVRLATFKQIK